MTGDGSSSVSVKRIADTSDFERAAASSSTPATRNSKKRRRDECRMQSTEFINRGDQDWVDELLDKELPSVPHQVPPPLPLRPMDCVLMPLPLP